MRRVAVMSAAAALLAVAGCSGGGEAQSTDGATTLSPTSTAPTTPTETGPTATVEQYASIVAKNTTDMRKMFRDLENPQHCLWGVGLPDVRPGYGTCGLQITTMSYVAGSLALSLQGAQKETAPAYIGAPPPEIEGIVTDTIATAQSLRAASSRAEDCAFDLKTGCNARLVTFHRAMGAMEDQVAAWQPYL